MHTESRDDIARRLASAELFDWLPGMLAALPPEAGGGALRYTENSEPLPLGAFPDLSDGATRGALLDLVRAAYADPTICPYRAGDTWEVYCDAPDDSPIEDYGWPITFDHSDEGAALALALISRPSLDAPPAEEG